MAEKKKTLKELVNEFDESMVLSNKYGASIGTIRKKMFPVWKEIKAELDKL